MKIFYKYYWKDVVLYKIRAFFNPRQKWLTKKIPNTWCDKPELMQTLLFEIIINFVEEENGLDPKDHIVDWFHSESSKKIWNDILGIYNDIKVKLPALNKTLEEETDILLKKYNIKYNKEESEEQLKKVSKIEEKISDLEQDIMYRIIKVRPYLWT